jgi:hypothetical protein
LLETRLAARLKNWMFSKISQIRNMSPTIQYSTVAKNDTEDGTPAVNALPVSTYPSTIQSHVQHECEIPTIVKADRVQYVNDADIYRDADMIGSCSNAYYHIPEARNLVWQDDYFVNDSDVIAVFDFDYDAMETYYSSIGWTLYGGSLFCLPNLFTLMTFSLLPCYLRNNVSWNVRSKHVAITREGIRFVVERHPTCYGHSCMDAGRSIKMVSKSILF